jgi:hypothetical protein
MVTHSSAPPPENDVLKKLVAAGAAIALRGYIGPSSTNERITLFPSLDDLSYSIEIASSDVVHFETLPEVLLPHGGIVVWVKNDAEITHRRVERVTAFPRANGVEVRAGRLRIIRQSRLADPPPPPCESNPPPQGQCFEVDPR